METLETKRWSPSASCRFEAGLHEIAVVLKVAHARHFVNRVCLKMGYPQILMFNHPTSHVKCYFMGASHFRTHPSDDHQEVILRSPDHRNLSCGPSVSASKNSCLLSWPHWDWPWWPETPKPPEKLRPSKAGAANYDAEHYLDVHGLRVPQDPEINFKVVLMGISVWPSLIFISCNL